MNAERKNRVFFFHYNKPASRAAKRNIISVHHGGVCHLVHEVRCEGVNLQTRQRNKQPYCVLAGRGVVSITGETAVISNR